jgi:hypothetical protein
VRRAGNFPSQIVRVQLEMRSQRHHVAFRLQIEHRDIESSMDVYRTFAVVIVRAPSDGIIS